MPATFASAPGGVDWKQAEPSAHLARGEWWTVFGDLELNRLEALATKANPDVAATAARYALARALAGVARSELFPEASLDPSYSRQRTLSDQSQPGRGGGESGHTFSKWTVPLEAGWEVDLWGRVRRQTEAAEGRVAASADDLEATKLAVQAEVATDYFLFRALSSERDLLERSVDAFLHSLELTRNRRAGGVASDLDVAQAETQVRATEAQVPAVELQRTQARHALAVLCGQPASRFQIAQDSLTDYRSGHAPDWVPSELLERRPDIAAAERRMAAANAEIGVAKAAYFPRVRLSGVAGFQSADVGTLFDWPSRLWAIGPSVEFPLFVGGRNRAQLAAARANYDEAVARYRRSVLTAFQEVEDGLAAGQLLQNQLEAERAALSAAQRMLEIANNRYRAGLVTFLEVATAQSAALTRERTVVQLQAQRLIAGAGLIRALGGGWKSEMPSP